MFLYLLLVEQPGIELGFPGRLRFLPDAPQMALRARLLVGEDRAHPHRTPGVRSVDLVRDVVQPVHLEDLMHLGT